MRIAICCKRFGPRGGAERFLGDFVRRLVGDGHRAKVLAGQITGPTDGVETAQLTVPRVPKAFRDLALAVASEKALRREEADVTFSDQKCWGADAVRPGGGVQREYVKQRIKTYHPLPYRLLKRAQFALSLRERLRIYIDDRLYRSSRPRCIIVNSRMVARHLQHHYPHLAGRIRVVHNGIDPSRYHPGLRDKHRAPVRQQLDIPDDALVGVFVATNWRRKGLWPLLEATALVKKRPTPRPFYLVILGSGSRARARIRARRLGVTSRLRIVGRQPAGVYYGASDIVVLPTYFDTFGFVVLEGMACGLPAITTVHAGAHEILTDQAGYALEDPEDVTRMADRIESFMDRDRLRGASRAALEAARPYTCERQYRAIMDAIAPIAAGA